jgi:hypothetical protein
MIRGLFGVVLVSALSVGSAVAEDADSGFTFIEFQTDIAQAKCDPAMRKGFQKCFVESRGTEVKGIEAALGGAAQQNQAAVPGQATGGGGFGSTGRAVGSQGAINCSDAYGTCATGCRKAKQELIKEKNKCEQGKGAYAYSTASPRNVHTCTYVDSDLKLVDQGIESCKTSFYERGKSYAGLANESAAAQKAYEASFKAASVDGSATGAESGSSGVGGAASKTLGWMKENPGITALGVGGAAVGGLLWMNASNNAAEERKQKKEEKKRLAAIEAAKPLDCTPTDSASNPKCNEWLTAECSNPSNIAGEKCQRFVSGKCGAADADSQMCQDYRANLFCKNKAEGERNSCFSCRNLRDRQNSTCQSRPEVCLHENTEQEMGVFKHSCADDPVFMLPRWKNVVATAPPAVNPPAPTAGAPAAGQPGTSAPQPVSTNPVGQPTTGRDTARLITSTNPAARTVALQSNDVAPRFGPNVFSYSSQAVQVQCERGDLNNCGSRTGVRQ